MSKNKYNKPYISLGALGTKFYNATFSYF